MNFGDFPDGGTATDADYVVGYAAGGAPGSDRRWTRAGLLTPPVTMAGLTVSATGSLDITLPGFTTTEAANYSYNSIIVGDSIDNPNLAFNTAGLYVQMITGGATGTGHKDGIYCELNGDGGPHPAGGTGGDFVAGNFYCITGQPNGGTNTGAGAKGTVYGVAPGAALFSGATNFSVCSGGEANAIIFTGASARHRWGWSIVGNGDLRGSETDAALEIGCPSANASFTYGIFFDNHHGFNPLPTNGTVIGTDGSAVTVANFADFSTYTFTGNIFNFANFTVTGAGALTATSLNETAAWTTFTCTATPGSGSITAQTSESKYKKIGKTVFVAIHVTITNAGTGAGGITLNLPFAAGQIMTMHGRENALTGKSIQGVCGSGTTLAIFNYDNSAVSQGTGADYVFSGVYMST